MAKTVSAVRVASNGRYSSHEQVLANGKDFDYIPDIFPTIRVEQMGESNRRGPQLRKLYYSIGEVSEHFAIPAHVLRYWEQEFPQLRPKKNTRSGSRLYQEKDLRTVERIKTLLYDKRFTIAGARSQLSLLDEVEVIPSAQDGRGRTGLVEEVKTELREILQLLK